MHSSAKLALAALVAAAVARAGAQDARHVSHDAAPAVTLGAITFPTSAPAAAHAAFVRGVQYLHNFHYALAAEAFRAGRAADPRDVMNAAFEALAYTAPVWDLQDSVKARAALRTLAPTRDARLALARTPRERAWLDAVESLYAEGASKPARDTAFSRAMARLHASDPRDAEAATFYALSLLGLNQGDREPVAYAAAEAIVDTVLRAHPRHPGALHYKIHAVDDPQNAARGLAAARAYGEVAPSAGHALHMTSHIYLARGLWNEVVEANRRAQSLSPHAFGHTTHWLVYGLIQQGRDAEARAWVDSTLALRREILAAGGNPRRTQGDVNLHAVLIPATFVIDAEAWDTPLGHTRPDTTGVSDLATRALADFVVGYAAARRAGRPVDVEIGSRAADRRFADSVLARMAARRAALGPLTGPDATAAAQAAVMEDVLRAELLVGARSDSAVALLRAAATRLEALPFAFGPPAVAKPPRERAAELLLFAGKPAAALAELDLAEKTTPGRYVARLRRARALDALGRRAEARREYAILDSLWRGADVSFPFATEARTGAGRLASAGTVTVDTLGYASGELTLRGERWRPASAARSPAIVLLHGSGGCWRGWEAELLGRTFASRGYVAFFPCRRGLGLSAGQGEAVLDQLRREGLTERDSAFARRSTELLTTTQLQDVRAAIDALRARAEVDPSRVAVAGISYGGILTLLAAEADSTLRAAVAFAPAAMNWAWNAPLRTRLLDAARRSRVPTMVAQAANDWSVGPTEAIPAAGREAGRDMTGKVYPAVGLNTNEGHGLMVTAPSFWEKDVLGFLDARLGGRR